MLKSSKFKFSFFVFMMVLSAQPTSAAFISLGEEDVLTSVSHKLSQIENRLKDQRVFVTPENIHWPEIDDFNRELMFVVAHDPYGPTPKDNPQELMPQNLNLRLKHSWMKLEESVYRIGTLVKSEEWLTLKTDMDQFFSFREEYLYQPARVLIKTGQLTTRIDALRAAATTFMKNSQKGKKISVRVIDPVIEELSKELNELNLSVREIKELRKPKVVVNPSIFQEKNLKELGQLAAVAFGGGFVMFGFLFLVSKLFRRKGKKKVQHQPKQEEVRGFDYSEWLKRLEKNLHTFRKNEDNLTEDILRLINYSHELHEARKDMNQSESQEEFYASLERLNAAAVKIEDYFHKINLKKNSECSRQIVKMLVELCEAVEKGCEISLTSKEEMKAVLKVA